MEGLGVHVAGRLVDQPAGEVHAVAECLAERERFLVGAGPVNLVEGILLPLFAIQVLSLAADHRAADGGGGHFGRQIAAKVERHSGTRLAGERLRRASGGAESRVLRNLVFRAESRHDHLERLHAAWRKQRGELIELAGELLGLEQPCERAAGSLVDLGGRTRNHLAGGFTGVNADHDRIDGGFADGLGGGEDFHGCTFLKAGDSQREATTEEGNR
jgi:hypothetical protein